MDGLLGQARQRRTVGRSPAKASTAWAISSWLLGGNRRTDSSALSRQRDRNGRASWTYPVKADEIGWNSDGPQVMLKFRLASRNLFHDRLRFIATIVGIVFSIVLVTVQTGLYVGFGRMVTTMIDHAPADLWVLPLGTKSFEDPSLLDDRQRFRVLAVNGVAEAASLVIGFAQWRLPGGGTTPVFIVGSELRGLGLHPWDLVAGRIDDLSIPGAVAVDESYFARLGASGIGANAEIRDQKVEVAAVTKGIRSFTTTPYAFTGLDRARAYTGISPEKASYLLVRVSPDADVDSVRRELQENLSN